jgi:hypothetical protein
MTSLRREQRFPTSSGGPAHSPTTPCPAAMAGASCTSMPRCAAAVLVCVSSAWICIPARTQVGMLNRMSFLLAPCAFLYWCANACELARCNPQYMHIICVYFLWLCGRQKCTCHKNMAGCKDCVSSRYSNAFVKSTCVCACVCVCICVLRVSACHTAV